MANQSNPSKQPIKKYSSDTIDLDSGTRQNVFIIITAYWLQDE